MLKLLIKKQLFENFRGILVNTKTGKVRSKKGMLGMAILFIFIFSSLAFSFFGMSMILTPLFNSDLAWLIYALFGIMSIVVGVFINAFVAAGSLFKAKDNDFLLSLPIKPKNILFSRIFCLFVTGVLYSGCVWLPICLNGWIHGVTSIFAIIYDVLLTIVIGIFSTGLSCILGYFFARLTSNAKNKSLITLISSLLLLVVYYFTMFRIEEIFTNFVSNSSNIALSISSWGIIFVYMAKAALGGHFEMLIFTLISIAVFLIVYFFLDKNFINIATKSNNNAKVKKEIKYVSKASTKQALLKKEFRHFLSSPAYMLNTGIGILFVLAMPVLGFINRNDLNGILLAFKEIIPNINDIISLVIVAIVLAITSMDCISAPSISLEGNTLWIFKSLPIKTIDILEAKKNMHVIINVLPAYIATIILCLLFNIKYDLIILSLVVIYLFIEYQALIGLFFGVLRPNFNWTNETQPIKQSLNMLFVMILDIVLIAVLGLLYYYLRNSYDIYSYYGIIIVILMTIVYLLRRWLANKATKVFEAL